MIVADTEQLLRSQVQAWRQEGLKVAFVPTMGNLHDGHISLVERAREMADKVVVSIFVNPMQFNDASDLEKYPRTLDQDKARLVDAETDLLFFPEVGLIYPRGMDQMTRVSVPGLSDELEGEHRPGHFTGVTTVVCKLFNLVQPDVAVFGKKDYQQLLLIKRMVQDLNLPIQIEAAPTRRETSGLAMSSRNNHLDAQVRQNAAIIHEVLEKCVDSIAQGVAFAEVKARATAWLDGHGFETEYVAVREQESFQVPKSESKRLVVLIAARISGIRLIDNLELVLG